MIWPKQFTSIALTFIFVILFVHFAFFPEFIIPLEIILFGIVVIIFVFTGLNYFTKKWRQISEKKFVKSLFITSLIVKLIFFASTLLLIHLVEPESFPFEITGKSGADAISYHQVATNVAKNLYSKDLSRILLRYFKERSDFGYPTYLGFLYNIFGNDSILIRIISLFISCMTVVLIYKLAKIIYGEKIGRFAGILTMLFPSLLWYDTALLKESIMIFLVIVSLYQIAKIVLSKKILLINIIIAIIPISILFYFRSFLPWLLIFVIFIYLLLNLGNRKVSRPLVFLSLIVIAGILAAGVIQSESISELDALINKSDTQLEDELISSAIERGLSFNSLTVIPLVLIGSVVTPFPSLLYFNSGQLVMVSHFFNELVRNALYFFAFIGIWISYKKHFKESSIVLLFTIGYLSVVTLSGKSFQDRFQLPTIPGMIILISVGLSSGKIYYKKWLIYLVVIGAGIILWNLFKLRIRGLI